MEVRDRGSRYSPEETTGHNDEEEVGTLWVEVNCPLDPGSGVVTLLPSPSSRRETSVEEDDPSPFVPETLYTLTQIQGVKWKDPESKK